MQGPPERLPFQHRGPVNCLAPSPSREFMLSASGDRTCLLFRPDRGLLLQQYKGHNYQVAAVQVAHNSDSFFAAGSDKSIFMWDVASAKLVKRSRQHEGRVNSLALREGVVFSGSYDCTIRAWDHRSPQFQQLDSIKGFTDSVSQVAVKKDVIFACSVDGSFRQFDVRNGKAFSDFFPQPVLRFQLVKKGQVLVSSTDSCITQILLQDGKVLQRFRGHVCKQYPVDLRQVGGEIWTGSQDGRIRVFGGRGTREVRVSEEAVCALGVGNSVLVAGGTGGQLWRVKI